MKQKTTLEERAVAGFAHLFMLVGVLITLINLIGWPLFPKSAYYFFIPNLTLSLIYIKRSRFVWSHLLQAVTLHAAALGLGLLPTLFRFLAHVGILGERWTYTGWGGYGMTPTFALMTMIMGFSGVVIFSLGCDASVKGFTGDRATYPLIGKYADRIAA